MVIESVVDFLSHSSIKYEVVDEVHCVSYEHEDEEEHWWMPVLRRGVVFDLYHSPMRVGPSAAHSNVSEVDVQSGSDAEVKYTINNVPDLQITRKKAGWWHALSPVSQRTRSKL